MSFFSSNLHSTYSTGSSAGGAGVVMVPTDHGEARSVHIGSSSLMDDEDDDMMESEDVIDDEGPDGGSELDEDDHDHDEDDDDGDEEEEDEDDEEGDDEDDEDDDGDNPHRSGRWDDEQSRKEKDEKVQQNQAELRRKIVQIQQDTRIPAAEKAKRIQELMTSSWSTKQKSQSTRGALASNKLVDKREDFDLITEQDTVRTYHDKNTGIYGCKHYQRATKLQAHCCGKWYSCRFCHDEVSDHNIIRNLTTTMMCMYCLTVQPAGQDCINTNCTKRVAKYYCKECKLWDDDPRKNIYHCYDCGICRIGKGLGIDYFHCKKCNVCMAISLKGRHKCIERNLESDCPICGEYMFTSTTTVIFMPCGHCIHYKCHQEYIQTSYQCPTCFKSLANMSEYFKRIDNMLAQHQMPPEYANTQSFIYCNDCEKKCYAKFHFLYHKCIFCKGYNTKVLQTIEVKEGTDLNKSIVEQENAAKLKQGAGQQGSVGIGGQQFPPQLLRQHSSAHSLADITGIPPHDPNGLTVVLQQQQQQQQQLSNMHAQATQHSHPSSAHHMHAQHSNAHAHMAHHAHLAHHHASLSRSHSQLSPQTSMNDMSQQQQQPPASPLPQSQSQSQQQPHTHTHAHPHIHGHPSQHTHQHSCPHPSQQQQQQQQQSQQPHTLAYVHAHNHNHNHVHTHPSHPPTPSGNYVLQSTSSPSSSSPSSSILSSMIRQTSVRSLRTGGGSSAGHSHGNAGNPANNVNVINGSIVGAEGVVLNSNGGVFGDVGFDRGSSS
ncbi:hypothetical protein HDU76_004063 [Blyttiomyces sp. JEL0837]|nr:hypothetical protein HDU76_004063 [Blyttiomyces sp. JEL0837]